MNYLGGGSAIIRYSRNRHWRISAFIDSYKSSNTGDDMKRNSTSEHVYFTPENNIKLNKNNSNIIPGFYCLQVRFKNECNRLHRDMEFPKFDHYRKNEYRDVRKTKWGDGETKQGTTYVLGFFGLLAATYSCKTVVTQLVSFMAPAADVLALASIEVEIGKIAPGACLAYKWRGKPLFVKHRTEADIELEAKTAMTVLRDPQTAEERTIKPEWLVVVGICTHLGCVPIPNSGDWAGGFYCPCHGSHYDNVGRTRKGPAPLNLEVPPYKFLSDDLIQVG